MENKEAILELLILVILIGVPLFFRIYSWPKFEYNEKKIRENAKIKYVFTGPPILKKHERIRTTVTFDDDSTFSASKYYSSGFLRVSVSEEIQLEIIQEAIKKHDKVVQHLKKNGRLNQ